MASGQTAPTGGELPRPATPTGRPKSRLELELPAKPAKPTDAGAPAAPRESVEQAFAELAKYPSDSAIRAIETLVARGGLAIEPLREILRGTAAGPKPAAALVLARLKDDESLPLMVGMLDDQKLADKSATVYEAIETLSPEHAFARALGHADDPSAKLRAAALRVIRRRATAANASDLVPLLRARAAQTRKAAFVMLERTGYDLSGAAIEMLGDGDSQISTVASRWLASAVATAECESTLTRIAAEDPPGRRASWALVTLAELEDRTGRAMITPELIPVLEKRLTARDPLEKVAAAIALTHALLRRQDDDATRALGEKVLPALMEPFLRNEFFKDFVPLFALAGARVKRITGADLGQDLAKWRAAWQGDGKAGSSTLVRRDLDVATMASGLGKLVVRYRREGLPRAGRTRFITLAGADLLLAAKSDPALADATFLDAEHMKTLFDRLRASGVVERGPRTLSAALGVRSFEFALDNRLRATAVTGENDPEFARAEAALFDAERASSWQRLLASTPEAWVERVRAEAGAYGFDFGAESAAVAAAPDDPARRAGRLVQATIAALPRLSRQGRVDALLALIEQPECVAAAAPEDLRQALAALQDESLLEGAPALAVQLIASKRDPELFGPTAEFLVARFGDDSIEAIGRLASDLDAADVALAHPLVAVRVAALRALAPPIDASTAGRVEILLSDPDVRVRKEAVLALARFGDPTLRARLFDLARGEDRGIRRVAIEALGLEGSDEAVSILVDLVNGAESPLALSAARGLARTGNGRGVLPLESVLDRAGPVDPLGLAALDGLAALARAGDGAALDALKRRLGAEDGLLRQEAAWRLAELDATECEGALVAALEDPKLAGRAADALSVLLVTDGGEKGGEFVQRFRSEPGVTPSEWLRRSLDVDEFTATVSDAVEGIPLARLLDALEDRRWFVRAGAARVLERAFSRKFGQPARWLTDADSARIAARWRGWFAIGAAALPAAKEPAR